MGINYSPKIVTDNLVLCLDAANPLSYPGSGNTWYDLSGNGNNGTLVNGVAHNNQGYFTLNGIDGWISTLFNPNINNNRLLTMEIWWRDDAAGLSSSTNTALISNYNSFTTPFLNLHVTSDGQVYLLERNSSGTQSSYSTSSVITDGYWKQIVAVCDATQMRLVINGSMLQPRNRVGGTISSGQNWIIGGNHLARYQSCDIALVRIYLDKAFSNDEILENYLATKGRFGL